jgi:predicted nucleic acid-binding protein
MIHGIDTSFLVAVEVAGHPAHAAARRLLDGLLVAGDSLALAPQVLAEFLHVVTDDRRFTKPLDVREAQARAERWWTAREVIATFPDEHTVPLFLGWLREHRLGRKRLLDTLLAATYFTGGVQSILTTDQRDFRVFGRFAVREP